MNEWDKARSVTELTIKMLSWNLENHTQIIPVVCDVLPPSSTLCPRVYCIMSHAPWCQLQQSGLGAVHITGPAEPFMMAGLLFIESPSNKIFMSCSHLTPLHKCHGLSDNTLSPCHQTILLLFYYSGAWRVYGDNAKATDSRAPGDTASPLTPDLGQPGHMCCW